MVSNCTSRSFAVEVISAPATSSPSIVLQMVSSCLREGEVRPMAPFQEGGGTRDRDEADQGIELLQDFMAGVVQLQYTSGLTFD
eukprot:6055368-Pleurochrysis_carterae.AAC.2